MRRIFIFIGSQLSHTLDCDTIGGINYSAHSFRHSSAGAYHLSITERTGGKHYDFFVKTSDECKAILQSILQSAEQQKDVTIILDADSNSPAALACFSN